MREFEVSFLNSKNEVLRRAFVFARNFGGAKHRARLEASLAGYIFRDVVNVTVEAI